MNIIPIETIEEAFKHLLIGYKNNKNSNRKTVKK